MNPKSQTARHLDDCRKRSNFNSDNVANSVFKPRINRLKLGTWNFSGAWRLELGASKFIP